MFWDTKVKVFSFLSSTPSHSFIRWDAGKAQCLPCSHCDGSQVNIEYPAFKRLWVGGNFQIAQCLQGPFLGDSSCLHPYLGHQVRIERGSEELNRGGGGGQGGKGGQGGQGGGR